MAAGHLRLGGTVRHVQGAVQRFLLFRRQGKVDFLLRQAEDHAAYANGAMPFAWPSILAFLPFFVESRWSREHIYLRTSAFVRS